MAGNVDKRIIQMQFENREFEKNIAKSTKSVEELKEAMDFEETSKGLKDFARSADLLDFSGLENNIQKLTDKFTGLGNIGEYVLSRIRSSLEGAAREIESFIKGLSTAQIQVGQGKYDEMNKAVMTIVSSEKATEEQAYETMQRIMDYTDQTSHSFNTMVGQLSNLTSIGMGLNEAERLLEGMGNAATFAGQGAENAALSMSVLSKSIGADYLGYEKFLQLSQTARVITDKWREQALEAGVAVGKLTKKNNRYYLSTKKSVEVTAKDLENTLRYKWLSGDVLKEIYKNYQFGETSDELAHPEKAADSFGKTAYLTGQRALTLVDALNAMKESVSSGWMETFRNLFGDVSEAAEHFTNIADRVIGFLEKIKEFRNNVLSAWGGLGGRKGLFSLLLGSYEDDAEEGAVGLVDMLEKAGSMVFEGFKEFMLLFGNPIDQQKVGEDPKYFSTYLAYKLHDIIQGIQDFFQRIRDFFNEEVVIDGKAKSRLEMIHDVVMGIAGAFKLAYDIMDGTGVGISDVIAQLQPSIDQIVSFFSELGISIYEMAEDESKGKKIQKFFEDLAATLKPLTDGINNVVTAATGFLKLLLGLDEESKTEGKTFETIGNFLMIIGDAIAKITGPVLDFLASVINGITELFKGGISQEKVKEFGANLGTAFSTMMKSFADNLPEGFNLLKNWIYDLFGLWEDETQGDSKSFFTFLRKLFTGGFKNFGEFLSQLTQGFSLKNALENGFGFGAAFNFLNTVIGWFKGTNLYSVIMAFFGVATLASVFTLVNRARKAINTIGGFFDDVGGNLMAGAMGRYQWFTEKLVDIAKAVGIFAACIFVLGSMDTGRLVQGGIALAVILGMVIGLWILLEKTSIATSSLSSQIMMETLIVTLAGAVAAICIAVSVLMLAIIPLASDWKRMATAVVGFGAFMLILGAFFVIMLESMDKFTFSVGGANQWAGIGKMAAMMFTLAGAVALLAVGLSVLFVALTPLALTGWEGMIRAIIAFGAVLAMIGIFIVVMINQMDTLAFTMGGGKSWSGIVKMAAMIIVLAGSVALLAVGIGALVVAITPLALMSTEGLVRALVGLGAILLELGAMIKYLQAITTVDKSASIKIAGLFGFAVGLGILVLALTPLALMSWESWTKALVGLGVVLLELGFMIQYVTNMNVGDKTASVKIAGLAGFALSIGILVFALQPFAGMEFDKWAQAIGGLAFVLLELIGFMWLAQKVKVDGVALSGFIGFAISIGILIFALKPLSEMTPEGYVRALVGLATVLIEVIVLMAIMNELKPDLKTAGSTMLLLIALGASMVLFGVAFNEVKDVPWQTIAAFAAGIAVLAVGIALAAKLANGAGLRGMLILALGLAAVMGVIALMAPILIGSVMGALRDAAGDLVIIADLISTFSGKTNGVDESDLDKAKRLIDTIGSIIAKIASFVFDMGATSEFMTCMAQLNLAAGQMIDFNEKIDQLSADGGTQKALDIITTYEMIFTEHLSKFSDYLGYSDFFYSAMYNMGSAFDYFDDMTKNLAAPEDNKGLGLIKELAACAPNLDTIYKMDLDRLRDQLAELGGAMIIYAKGAESVNGKEITADTDIGGAIIILQKISESLSQAGGFSIPANMPEDKELEHFGVQLAALAGALVAFENAGQGLGKGTREAINALDYFYDLKVKLKENFGSDLNDAIQSFKNANGDFINQDELTTFGEDIAKLGSSMAHFAESTQIVDEETKEVKPIDFTKATDALNAIASLHEKLPDLGGVAEAILGKKKTLDTLATDIKLLGGAMSDFYKKTHTVNDGVEKELDFSNATTFLKDIANISVELNKIHIRGFSIESLFANQGMRLGDLASQLEQLGPGLTDFSKRITGEENGQKKFDAEAAKEATKLLDETIVPFMSTLANRLPKIGGLGTLISDALHGHGYTLKDLGDQLGQLGPGLGELGAGLSNGQWSQNLGVEQAFSALDSLTSILIKLDQINDLYGAGTVVNFTKLTEFVQLLAYGLSEDGETANLPGQGKSPVIEALGSFMDSINTAISKFAESDKDLKTLQDRLSAFKTFVESICLLASTDMTGKWDGIGEKITSELATSIVDGTTNVITSIETMMKTARSSGENVEGVSWFALGEYIGLGIKNGVDFAGPVYVTPAVKKMMVEAYNAGKEAIDSNSPSKLFAELGEFMGEGTAIGIKDSTDEVGKSAARMGDVALDSARDMIGLISRIMAEGVIDEKPTIAPVLDLTNIQAGMAEFRNSLDGYSVNLDTAVSASRAAQAGAFRTAESAEPVQPDYSGFYTRMETLGTQIAQMENSIKQMKLVLDTGVIAGGVTDRVDELIGQKIWLINRGNTV
jgi:hypothetical protein